MSTPAQFVEPINFSELRNRLEKWLEKHIASTDDFNPPPRRVTFVLGAGVSLALANPSKRSQASWTGLLSTLLGGTSKRLNAGYLKDGLKEHLWLKQTSVQHRMHIIQILSQGNADMSVAMMYLLNRLHRQHITPRKRKNIYSWQEDLNAAMHQIEQGAPDDNWQKVLKQMGQLAREGKTLLVTTNFDHLVAKQTKLPIYLGPRKITIPASIKDSTYCTWPDGCLIPTRWVKRKAMLKREEFATSILRRTLPAPAAFHQAWKRPSSIPQSWFTQLASVLHIHGSRLLPTSLVFDPSSYDSISDSGDGSNLLGSLIHEPTHSGAVIFIGCGGTLFDPHFIKYWQNRGKNSFVACLASEEAADDLARQFHIFNFRRAPLVVSYGKDHADLPKELKDLLALL